MSIKRSLPAILSVLIIIGAIIYLPWAGIWDLLKNTRLSFLPLLMAGSLSYLGAKAIRFWIMLDGLDENMSLNKAILLYCSAQTFTFLPGGDFYRSQIMKHYADIPIRKSTAAIILQALLEGTGLVLAGMICALATGQAQGPLVAAMVLFIGILFFVRSEKWLLNPGFIGFLKRLPLVKVNQSALKEFCRSNRILLSASKLPLLSVITFVPILAGIAIVYFAANGLSIPITIVHAAIAFVLPTALGYVAVLPGASEGGMVGVLVLIGHSLPEATAITLMTRVFMLGTNFIVGPVSLLLLKRANND